MSRAEATRRVGASKRRMPRHLLPAFSVSLLLLGCACGPAYCANGGPVKSVTLFVPGETKVPDKVGSEDLTRDVSSFGTPFLVGGNGVMVAIAEVGYTASDEESVDIVARYIDTEGPSWETRAFENIETNWRTQLALQRKEGTNHFALRSPTAVIKGNKIYLLALNNRTNGSPQNGNGWHFELSVGAITGEVGSKKIEWGPSESLHFKLTQEVENRHLKVFPGSNNSAFLTSNRKIVFSANATNKEGAKGNAILQLKDDEEQWKVSFVENPGNCRHFSLFEWKERLISVFFGCSTDTNYAKEYDEVKEEWKDADDRLLHVWISEHKPSDLYSVTIENKTALLFMDEKGSGGVSDMPLWFTDGNRIKQSDSRIKTLYEFTSGGLLYTNGEFFVIYQNTSKGLGAFVLTHLNQEMETIKSVLKTWDEKDAYLSRPCKETASENASPDTLCVTPMPTDGLVGFLSNKGDDSSWHDEYLFANAEVSGTKLANGYTFSEADSGARWPVGQVYSSNWYDVAKYGLTVVATVTIHETPKNDNPLLTVGGVGSDERLGLWYKDKQWKVVSKNNEEPVTDLKIQKEHRVALILHNNNISAYVNGNSQGGPLRILASDEKPFDIASVQIGAYKLINSIHMTVTNVFLYNRALSDTELAAISKTIETATPNVSESTTETTTTSEETPGTTRDPEDSFVCVRTSFTSLFLLGCFCLAIF